MDPGTGPSVGRGSGSTTTDLAARLAARVVADLIAVNATVATGESVTGGRVVAALTSVPGSSSVVRGGVVAYTADVKVGVLGVDTGVLAGYGPVSAEVAEQMAEGARRRLGAAYGVATTGEAGPESASGRPVGLVHTAVAGPLGTTSRPLRLSGGRAQIQASAATGALVLLAEVLQAADPRPEPS